MQAARDAEEGAEAELQEVAAQLQDVQQQLAMCQAGQPPPS